MNNPGSSMKLVSVLESVAQFLRQPRLWSILVLRVRLIPFSKILVCLLCRLVRFWTVLHFLRQFVRNTCRHIHLKTVLHSQPVHLFLHLAILQTSGGRSLLKVIKQSFRRLCRSLLQQSAKCGSQKEWKLLMIWPACTRRHDRSATIWTSTAWKINTLIPLLKAGLLPGDGYPVGRDTTCGLVPFQTTKYLRVAASVKSAQMACLLFSNSQIPTQATTTTGEPAFHSSSPVILQELVQVIVKMGPHSRFSVEVSDGSELTMQLLQRRFPTF